MSIVTNGCTDFLVELGRKILNIFRTGSLYP